MNCYLSSWEQVLVWLLQESWGNLSALNRRCYKKSVCKAQRVDLFCSRAGGCRSIQVRYNWSGSSFSQSRDCWLCMGREEPGELSRIQSYPVCRMRMYGEAAEKLAMWKRVLLLLQYFWIYNSVFQMGVEGHFVLLAGKCYLLLVNAPHPCYKTKHFFSIRQRLFWC